MLFEYSLDGGANWTTLDVNNDDDFYANLDGLPGFKTDDYDEVFNDLDGDYVYTPGVDFVRYAGADGVVDTPAGWPLLPLIGEDGGQDNLTDGVDDDNDTVIDNAAEALLRGRRRQRRRRRDRRGLPGDGRADAAGRDEPGGLQRAVLRSTWTSARLTCSRT
ncbi:MAG: hypothetical protein MZV65_29035 [Chromatiales bacterium]|nr:hypothetical protein [Chromatiales bacterium]